MRTARQALNQMKPLNKTLRPSIGEWLDSQVVAKIIRGQIRHRIHNELKQQVIVRTRYHSRIKDGLFNAIGYNLFEDIIILWRGLE